MRRATGLRRAWGPAVAALLLAVAPLAAQEPAGGAGADDAASDLAGPTRPLPAEGGARGNGALPPPDATLRLAPSAAMPETAMPVMVIVDQEALYRQSLWGLRAQAELAAQSRQVAADNDRAFANLVADEDALTAARARLSPGEFRVRATEFDERVMAIRRERDQAREALSDMAERDRALFFQAAAPVLGRVMLARGALIMLDQRMVLIADDRIDVTADSIAALNSELGDGHEIVAAAQKAQAGQDRASSGGDAGGGGDSDVSAGPDAAPDPGLIPGAAPGPDPASDPGPAPGPEATPGPDAASDPGGAG